MPAAPKVDWYLVVSRTKGSSNSYDISASSRIIGLTNPRARTASLGTDRTPTGADLAGDQVQERPGGDGLRAGQVPHLADGALVGAEGGQAGGDVGHVAVGVGQVRVADEVGALAGQGVAEDPLASVDPG